jgi:hypothetical protein
MNLNATADINSAIEYIANHGNDVRPEVFYNKQLLDTIRLEESNYVHYRLADSSPIQGKAEKLQLRRWAPLKAHTTPLAEGVPPTSDKGSMESYEISTFPYGRYMEFTDRVDMELIDPVIAHYTKEYNLVAMETLDILARDALLAVGQSYFANDKANMQALEIGDKPSLDDLRVIVLSMKKQLVKPRSNGKFHVIASPDFFFDMISDPLVEKYMTFNNTTKPMYDDGSLVPMFNMEFYETQAGDESGEYVDGDGNLNLLVYRYNTNTGAYEYDVLDEATYMSETASYDIDGRTGEEGSFFPENRSWDLATYNATAAADGYGDFQELKVHRTLILGKDALIKTNISGGDNAKMYVKPLGSAGVLDPIDQRQSIGFKINGVGFGSPRLEAIAVYYNIPTQSNLY